MHRMNYVGAHHHLLAGDMVEGKTPWKVGQQHEQEWQDYASFLDALLAAGVDPGAILDSRGNHDSFNVPWRSSAADYFARGYSATSRAGRNATG